VAAPRPELWGDLKPVVSVKELMRDMIDPLADDIFDAAQIVNRFDAIARPRLLTVGFARLRERNGGGERIDGRFSHLTHDFTHRSPALRTDKSPVVRAFG